MTDVLLRLKRRKIVQWALAYVAAAFAVLQGFDIVAQRFGWPEAIERGLIVAIVVGFFVTIVLAWYHGERGHQRVTSTELVILALLLAIGGSLLWRFAQVPREGKEVAGTASPKPAASIDDKSIAVLPFANLSDDKSNAYFAEGMQDEILTRLAQIASLRVASRTSTEQFASKPANIADIARQLGVANILEGSVEKAANRVRINVQLIRADEDRHIWAEIYDKSLDDVFGVQGEVSKAIADALGAKLSGSERNEVAAIPTHNAVAYEAYLRGLASYTKGFQSHYFAEASAALREAVAADPNYAQAWALLARVEATVYFFGTDRTEKHRAEIRGDIETAERLQPSLYETQLARAFYVYRVEEDYDSAYKAFGELHARHPDDTEVLATLGYISARQGRIDALNDYVARAIALEPNNVRFRKLQVISFTYQRRFDDALASLDDLARRAPDDRELATMRGSIYLQLGDLKRAEAILDLSKADADSAWQPFIELLRDQRNFAPAIAWLESRAAGGDGFTAEDASEARLCLADLQRFAGDTEAARANYLRARDQANAILAQQSDNGAVRNTLALAQASLGDETAARAALDRDSADVARSGDTLDRGREADTRVRAETRLGHKDAAIDGLPGVLGNLYAATSCTVQITVPLLRLDPEFDSLRDDPRFQALLK